MPVPNALQAHPWHGISPGDDAPEIVNAYIEIVPGDTVKYEVDKSSGHLKLDRPQKFSSQCPAPYGFVPRTWCRRRVGDFAAQATGRHGIVGDGDPVDICVLTVCAINHASVLLRARLIGGLRLLDRGEADDKLIGVLVDDPVYAGFRHLSDVPAPLIDRLRHYFLTYKQMPDAHVCEITHAYDAEVAHEVVRLAMADYAEGHP